MTAFFNPKIVRNSYFWGGILFVLYLVHGVVHRDTKVFFPKLFFALEGQEKKKVAPQVVRSLRKNNGWCLPVYRSVRPKPSPGAKQPR